LCRRLKSTNNFLIQVLFFSTCVRAERRGLETWYVYFLTLEKARLAPPPPPPPSPTHTHSHTQRDTPLAQAPDLGGISSALYSNSCRAPPLTFWIVSTAPRQERKKAQHRKKYCTFSINRSKYRHPVLRRNGFHRTGFYFEKH